MLNADTAGAIPVGGPARNDPQCAVIVLYERFVYRRGYDARLFFVGLISRASTKAREAIGVELELLNVRRQVGLHFTRHVEPRGFDGGVIPIGPIDEAAILVGSREQRGQGRVIANQAIGPHRLEVEVLVVV